MRHGYKGRKFSRTTGERRALLSNLACALIKNDHIKTTLPKAKDIRPYVERLITMARADNLSANRRAIAILRDREAVTRLMKDVAPRFKDRNGGYTRIIKAGYRYGDSAPMAIIQFVDYVPQVAVEAVEE